MKTNVLLVGGRSKARALALSLLQKGYRVAAINRRAEDCRALAEIQALTVISGDGTRPFVLEDAGAQDADIAIALTPRDDDNLVICQLCKKRFHVKKTVALISDPRKTEFFYQMGIDSVVCAISVIARIVEQQAFLEKIATRIPIGEGSVSIAEVPIGPDAPAAGKKLWEIALPKEAIVGCILRAGQTLIPRGETRIAPRDVLILICAGDQENRAVKELTGK